MNADGGDVLRRRDEILQVMFWMRGEGIAEAVGVQELRLFLTEDAEATLAGDLASLAAAGLLEAVDERRYRLSEQGRAEGGRRFQDEFAELMRPGHGACSDPSCDCHALGPDACVHAHS
jgi:hypothetical protein